MGRLPAGSLLLCYGQQLSRIAVMTTEQVRRHDDLVSLRFGAHNITVAEPLAGLLTELIDVGRSHRGVGSPGTSPMAVPRAPTRTTHHRVTARRTPTTPRRSSPPRTTRHTAPTCRPGPRRRSRRTASPHARNGQPMDPRRPTTPTDCSSARNPSDPKPLGACCEIGRSRDRNATYRRAENLPIQISWSRRSCSRFRNRLLEESCLV